MITWKHNGRALLMEMEATMNVTKNGAWLAVGISKDGLMGNDTVFECHFHQNGSGSVHLSYNHERSNKILQEVKNDLMKPALKFLAILLILRRLKCY
ncbi:hypothetical protein DICVIV_11717 [Dictyocaulus viviparus]|uniref:DOMON domain-containing protein n=1 Tax=Dictyocaulus viviparus TaxID=29172 RepID=A0A0D8XCI0_DICVI|nr:hypothetical protein DICVIV_11717 [Dictyocaulus viviparus]